MIRIGLLIKKGIIITHFLEVLGKIWSGFEVELALNLIQIGVNLLCKVQVWFDLIQVGFNQLELKPTEV